MQYVPHITTEPFGDRHGTLICPRCDANTLHHDGITSFDRREDDDRVIVTAVNGTAATVETKASAGSGNPSNRRDGLVIAFHCEGCGDGLELTLAQHKGSTVIGWRLAD